MRIFLFSALIVIVLLSLKTFSNPALQDEIPVKGYNLFWNDEFDGTSLNHAKWNYRGLGKRGDAYISKEAIKLDGKGHLIIEVKRKGDSILIGMIATENIFETCFGYFECRASLTKTSGAFPAFWLQSPLINREIGGPEVNGAEIDIFEYFQHARKDSVSHTLHWGGYGASHKVAGPVWGALRQTKDGFHTFGLQWTPDTYTTFVDGIQTYSGKTLTSKVPEFMVLSLGVDKLVGGPLDEKYLPDQFTVDYVRVYKPNNKPSPHSP